MIEISTLEVRAPCAMEAGFTFMAQRPDGHAVPVTVPKAVQEGEVFRVPQHFVSTEFTPFIPTSAVASPQNSVTKTGEWKTPLFDCFRLGLWHPSLCHSIFCPQILMAQVANRLQLDWLGRNRSDSPSIHTASTTSARSNFRTVLLIVIVYWVLSVFLAPSSTWANSKVENGVYVEEVATDSGIRSFLYNAIGWAFGLYTIILLTRVRKQIRLLYEIPASFLGEVWEDCCCAIWCGCCAASQMARQTCDYEENTGTCCSATGAGAAPMHILTI